jgi:nucleoside-diphosphate-sugar epimerase
MSESLVNPNFFNETFNLGTGIKTTIRELLQVINTTNKEIVVEPAVVGDMFGCVADNTKLKKLIPT